MTSQKTIFIVDDDKNIADLMRIHFEGIGFKVGLAYDGEEAYNRIIGELPDLIILDVMLPKIDGYALCQKLRMNERTTLLPIIMVTARDTVVDKIRGLRFGADDYLTKPFSMDDLIARVETLITRKEQLIATNPLTGLPGNLSIVENTNRRIRQKVQFAFAYLDINDFKAYNDVYGFHKGDEILNSTGGLIRKTIEKFGNPGDFIGHIGGDDFVFITTPDKADAICVELTTEFDRQVLDFYNETDRTNKYIITKDRRDIVRAFPLMSVSVAVVTNEKREFNHYGEIVDIVTELKRFAKSKKSNSSIFVRDRRTE